MTARRVDLPAGQKSMVIYLEKQPGAELIDKLPRQYAITSYGTAWISQEIWRVVMVRPSS